MYLWIETSLEKVESITSIIGDTHNLSSMQATTPHLLDRYLGYRTRSFVEAR